MKTLYFIVSGILFMNYIQAQSCIVGYYPLNGSIVDSVTGASGTNSGLLPGTDRYGMVGNALYFNGSSSGTLIDDYDYPVRTVSLWFKADSIGTNLSMLFETDHANVQNAQTQMGVQKNGGVNQIVFFIGGTGNTAYYNINTGQWYHIAAVRDVSQIRYYVDCQLVGTGSSITNSHSAQGITTSILGNASWGSWYFKGSMDEVRLYNCALSQNEINGVCTGVGINEVSEKNNCFNSMKVNLQLTDLQMISKVFELNAAPEKTELTIYNNIGQIIFTGTSSADSQLNLPALSNGIYYYSLKCNAMIKTGTISLAK